MGGAGGLRDYLGYILTALISGAGGTAFIGIRRGYNFIGYTLMAVAALSLFFMLVKMLSKKHGKAAKILNRIAVYAIILFAFALTVTVAMIASEASPGDNSGADYAIVLGAGVRGNTPSASLYARMKAALKYAEDNPDTVFILSGGQGEGENVSEARCMFDWLSSRGVSEDRLIMEDKATSTRENLEFSRALILEREPDFSGKICVVSEGYHIARGKLYAREAGFEKVTGAPGYNGYPVLTANYYIREVFAMWYYLVFER